MNNEGWTWLWTTPKWHYFREGRSLCGKWMHSGKGGYLEKGKDSSPDNCKACQQKLITEKKRKERT